MMGKYLIERPMLLSGIGCVLVSLCAFYSEISVVILLFVLPFILSIMVLSKTDIRLIAVSVLIFIMSISSFLTIKKAEDLQYHSGTKFDSIFTVCEVDYKSEEFYISTVEVIKSNRLENGVKIKAFSDPLDLKSGMRINATVYITETDDKYKRDNYSNATYLTGSLSNIEILKGNDIVLSFGEKIRDYIKEIFTKYTDYDVKATLCALIFGDNNYFTYEFYNCVKTSGVSHVMVVSGMHLSIIISFLSVLLERFYYSKYAKAGMIFLTVMLLWVLCGFTMSIIRAGVTYIFMALGIICDKTGKPENTLGAAVTFILITSPFAIFSVSLQLSLLSTFGILVIAVPIMRYIRLRNIIKQKAWIWFVNSVLLSISALVFTLPIVIYVFGGVSLVGVLTNMLISLPVTAVIIISVVGIFITLVFEPFCYPIFCIVNIITRYINSVILNFGKLPYSMVSVPRNFSFFALITILLIICVLLACKKRINMLKLKEVNEKIIEEGGGKLKWR